MASIKQKKCLRANLVKVAFDFIIIHISYLVAVVNTST